MPLCWICVFIWSVIKMLAFELNASSKGLSHIPMDLHDEIFEFHVGQASYKCNMIVAEFLSPKICNLRRADPTIDQYSLESIDPQTMFKDFLSLALESRLHVDSENFDFMLSVARELENQELVLQLISHYFAVTKLNTANAVQFLRMAQLHSEGDEQIAFIASNFHDIEDLSSLEIHHLRRILAHPSLRIQSEDALYSFICGLVAKDPSFSELFEFVIFKFLGPTSIQHFVETSSSYIFDHMNVSIWRALCARLSQQVLMDSGSLEEQKSRYGKVVTNVSVENEPSRVIKYESKQLDGIISMLRRQCGGNPDQKGLVKVNSNYGGTELPHQILEYDWNSWFTTLNQPNSWIELDMMQYKVSLTHYTLKSRPVVGFSLNSWIIECSNDRSTWDVVDERTTTALSGASAVETFPVQKTGTFYRYIRLRQTQKNSSGSNYLCLTNLEIFGDIK